MVWRLLVSSPMPSLVQFTFSQEEVVLARFSLEPGDYVVGRDESCQVVIDLEGMGARHARLRIGEEVLVEDLQSGAGTFLGGAPVTAPMPLTAQHAVTFGTCAGELRLAAKPAKRAKKARRRHPRTPPPPAEPSPALWEQIATEEGLVQGSGWEIWTTPGPPSSPKSSDQAEAGRLQNCRDRLNASEAVAASEMREILLAQEREIRELHADLARLNQEYAQLTQIDQQVVSEKERAKESAGLLSIANRALIRKLSNLVGPKDERAKLRRELQAREKALVESWARRQASDERCSQLSRQVARLEAGLDGPPPATPPLYLPVWLMWVFVLLALALALLGYGLRGTITRARAAEGIVTRLRAAAPQFALDAQELIAEGDFQHALNKIESAIALDPGDPDYHAQKGNICESLLLVAPALAAYEQALNLRPAQPEVRKNFELCRSVRASRRGAESAESQYAFHQIMLDQGRLPEALRMAERLPTDRALLHRTWSAILAHAGLRADLTLNPDGTFDLDLTAQSSVDLTLLRGLPLRRLVLARSNINDVTPLRGSSVQELDLSGNPLSDLSPLTGLALETLNLSNTSVSNLFPIAGMPLRELNLDHTPVSDVSPLRGLHLQTLRAAGTTVWNLQPLGESPLQTLDLGRTRVSDLSPLSHLPLHELHLDGTAVTNLQPLAGAPLHTLDLSRTPVRSLAPLSGAPLRELLLGGCAQLEGVQALAKSTELERLVLPAQCTNLGVLRALPHLRFLSYDQEGTTATASEKTAQQFWQGYAGK